MFIAMLNFIFLALLYTEPDYIIYSYKQVQEVKHKHMSIYLPTEVKV